MEETVLLQLMITMRSGRVVQLLVSNTEFDWLYDKMFGRKVGRFQNLGNMVVCIDDIEYLEWNEVEDCEVIDNIYDNPEMMEGEE